MRNPCVRAGSTRAGSAQRARPMCYGRGAMRGSTIRVLSLVASAVIAVGVALAVVAGAMTLGDHMGWIAHRRMATVCAVPDWRAGEEKSCELQGSMRTPTLVCDRGATGQRMGVEFLGPLHATEWRCEPGGEWMECKPK